MSPGRQTWGSAGLSCVCTSLSEWPCTPVPTYTDLWPLWRHSSSSLEHLEHFNISTNHTSLLDYETAEQSDFTVRQILLRTSWGQGGEQRRAGTHPLRFDQHFQAHKTVKKPPPPPYPHAAGTQLNICQGVNRLPCAIQALCLF